MKKRDERRLAENEVIFKQINKDADEFLHDVGVQNLLVAPFFCECSDLHCKERVELTPAEYERVHKNPAYFIVLKGHELLTIERVVEKRDGYSVVEKFTELPKPEEVRHRLKEVI